MLVSGGYEGGGEATYSTIFCFWDPEEYYCGLDTTPNGENNIGLPSDLLKRNGPGELIQEPGWGQCQCALIALEERDLPAATANPENPIPFALISNDRTSTGYNA